MVVGAFPAAKLGALLLKQISKPIANVVKSQAKSSPLFRKYICMPPAQFYNWCEIKAKMWILNLGKPVNIPVLNEAQAIELGANLLGEGIMFAIAAGIVISEYNRSSKKEAAKEEAKKQEILELQNTIRELFIQTEEQGAQLRELTRKLGHLETKLGVGPVSTHKSRTKSEKPNSKNNEEAVKDIYVVPNPSVAYQSNENITVDNKVKPINYTKQSSISYDSVILRAVDEIENQFWGYPLIEKQEDNVLFLSLYYIKMLLRLYD